jgi:hypothetical protein
MNIFVKKTDTVEVLVYVWVDKEGNVDATHIKDEVPKDTEIKEIKFNLRRPSYLDSTGILRQASTSSDRSLDVAAFQDVVLRNQIDSWDIKDDAGKSVPLNVMTVNELQPTVARAAVNGYLAKVKI